MNPLAIPFNALERQHDAALVAEIEHAMRSVVRSGWYVLGDEVAAFEREFAAFCGVAHAIGVGNGSDALEIALAALELPQGTRVAVAPNAAMYATLAILANGCTPTFVDVDRESAAMDLAALDREIDAGVGAIVVTHLYGRLGEIEAIVARADARGIPVIEDAAQAHGATRGGRRAGSFGTLACFSFYPTKNLGAIGDGGAVLTSDALRAERVRQLRQYGWAAKYDVAVAHGRNSRLDELQAAILRTKLPRLDGWNRRRREIARRYRDGISNAAILTPALRGDDDIAHLYVVRANARDRLRAHLAANGVRTDVHYPIPDHRQRVFGGRFDALRLPAAEELAATVLSLPCFAELRDDEVDCIIDACNRWQP